MSLHNIVNENEIVRITSNNNFNNNVIEEKYKAGRRIETIADSLVQKLGASVESRPFMCKAAWKLSEATLWQNVEAAQKGRNPIGLFIYLCKRDGV